MHRFSYYSRSAAHCCTTVAACSISNYNKSRSVLRRALSSIPSDHEVIPESPFPSTKWSWIPPRNAVGENSSRHSSDEDIIQVKKGVELTSDEISEALQRQGGGDVRTIVLKKRLDTIDSFVIVSGTSVKHLKKMADSIVTALKNREIVYAQGYTGYEGGVGGDHDWLCVDCHNIVVHIMLPAVRKAMDLEGHWTADERPFARTTLNAQRDDDYFEELLEKYPVPQDYQDSVIQEDKDTVSVRDSLKSGDVVKF